MTVVLVVLALAAAGAGAWWWGSSTRDYPGWLAALPVGNSAREDQRLADVSEAALAPGGGMLAARSSGTWSLYDLTSSDKAPVWSGDCYKAAFWNARTLLCQQSSSSRSVLVGTGGTAAVPGPKDTVYVGATQDYAVVVDKARNRSNGDLIALDAQGKEVWRAAGAYSKGMVRNGFVLTYEDNSDSVQVLSAATGEVLVSALDKEPDFDPEDRAWPGGFNIGTGTAAFSRVTSEGATVYNASGSQVRSVPGTFRNPPTWASSAPLDAEGLAQAYTAAAKNPSALQAIGPDRVVDVTVDTSTCTASAGGTAAGAPPAGLPGGLPPQAPGHPGRGPAHAGGPARLRLGRRRGQGRRLLHGHRSAGVGGTGNLHGRGRRAGSAQPGASPGDPGRQLRGPGGLHRPQEVGRHRRAWWTRTLRQAAAAMAPSTRSTRASHHHWPALWFHRASGLALMRFMCTVEATRA